MDMAKAIQVVLELAKQNMIDVHEMPDEHAKQQEAIDTVEDFAVNQLGDD